jgi:hypothetical protein
MLTTSERVDPKTFGVQERDQRHARLETERLRRTLRKISSAAVLTFALAACAGHTSTSPSTVTVTQHSAFAEPSASSTSAAASQVTIPDVKGRNAEIVRKNLEDLGLTEVSLSSANPKYTVVILASNWTAVSIEPPPGTVVNSGDPVVVKVYKD